VFNYFTVVEYFSGGCMTCINLFNCVKDKDK